MPDDIRSPQAADRVMMPFRSKYPSIDLADASHEAPGEVGVVDLQYSVVDDRSQMRGYGQTRWSRSSDAEVRNSWAGGPEPAGRGEQAPAAGPQQIEHATDAGASGAVALRRFRSGTEVLCVIGHHGRRVDRYALKRRLMRPITAWRRHRAGRLGPINRQVWEAQDYSPAMRRFYFAAKQNPGLLVDAELHPAAVVIDVGAYEGSWSMRLLDREWLRDRQDVRIHAYEPEPGAIERCRRTIADEPRIDLHPYGLAGHRRTERLTIGGPASSIYADRRWNRTRDSVEIELRDVADELTAIEAGRIDLVKINIEGGEYELLDRLHETGWLPRINTLIVQFHEFAPNAYRARRRNRRQLAETHSCAWNFDWVYERWDLKTE